MEVNLQYIYTEKQLQYIQMDHMVFGHSVLVKFSFIFHLIITHPTITHERVNASAIGFAVGHFRNVQVDHSVSLGQVTETTGAAAGAGAVFNGKTPRKQNNTGTTTISNATLVSKIGGGTFVHADSWNKGTVTFTVTNRLELEAAARISADQGGSVRLVAGAWTASRTSILSGLGCCKNTRRWYFRCQWTHEFLNRYNK